MTAITGRYVAERSVFISDKAVDTNSLHSTLQAVEILSKFLFFLIASGRYDFRVTFDGSLKLNVTCQFMRQSNYSLLSPLLVLPTGIATRILSAIRTPPKLLSGGC